tara:strand:- start:50869 stop:51561 length:693 start_codon:yes stop_codon:yes gene_type:complete
MDGNGRWALDRNMPRAFGHRSGISAINKIVKACTTRQINELTLFAFSSENWKRPEYEVNFLINLFNEAIDSNINNLNDNNIQLHFIGNLSKFNSKLISKIKNAETLTTNNTGLKLNLALNYGGKWDIVNAVQSIILNKKDFNIDDINCENIEKSLTLDSSFPDLLIRTGGEQRLSNFLLWQHAYTELYFTDCLWPDFNENELDKAIKWYQNINRKFGALSNKDISLDKNA